MMAGGFGGVGGRRMTAHDGRDLAQMRKLTIGLDELRKEQGDIAKIDKVIIGGSDTQRILFELQQKGKFNNFIQACVFLNILMLIFPYMDSLALIERKYKNLLEMIECFFVVVYIMEMLIKMFVFRKSYFTEIWDKIDFLLVVISVIDLVTPLLNTDDDSGGTSSTGSATSLAKSGKMLRVLRSTRILRLLRTMKWMGRLEQYVTTIVKACRSLGPLMRLFVALIVVFSCLACSLFGRILPDRFGNYLLSLFTLIQLLTLDDWFQILQEGSVYHYNPRNNQLPTFQSVNMMLLLFLILYIFLMTFIILNLLIAVLVDNFQVSFEQNKYKETTAEDEQKEFLNRIDNMDDIDDDRDNEDDGSEEKDEKDEFERFFEECSPTDLLLRQWYFRLLPAIEKHMFYFNDQVATYERIVDEAINSSDDFCHMTQ